MGTMKFKVGDKVRVKSLEWYDSNKNVHGDIYKNIEQNVFVRKMAQYCGKELNIVRIKNDFYIVKENIFCWQDWMLEEEAVIEEKKEVEQLNKIEMETKK